MKYPVFSVIFTMMTAVSSDAFAQSTSPPSSDVIIQRLDALDKRNDALDKRNEALNRRNAKLESENAALRDRVRLLEVGRRNTATATPPTTQTPSGPPQTAQPSGWAAMAADMPVKSKPFAPMYPYSSGGFYISGDGSYQSIHLPTYSLGLGIGVGFNGPTNAVDSFAARVPSDGFSGALGYQFPYNSVFGSEVRLEIGGSYVHGNATQSSGNVPYVAGNLVNLGATQAALGLGPGAASANLTTDYTVWQVNGKLSGNFKFNALTLTPSVDIFRNDGRNNQSLSQSIVGAFTASYQANTQLKWIDWGARVGLDAKYRFTDWVTAGIGGYVGAAERNVTMSGSDVSSTAVLNSAVASGAQTTTFLANAEAKLIFNPTSTVEIKAFAGLNYDNRVAGISSPNFTGLGTSEVPAGIKFEAETSYYVGGGVTAKFFPEAGPVVAKY
jgi:hypothetical protein